MSLEPGHRDLGLNEIPTSAVHRHTLGVRLLRGMTRAFGNHNYPLAGLETAWEERRES